MVAGEVVRAVGRSIGREVEVEYSRRGTRGQLVGGTVEGQVGIPRKLENVPSGPRLLARLLSSEPRSLAQPSLLGARSRRLHPISPQGVVFVVQLGMKGT